ncbi:MAG: LarC family nickel insertion protein [Thermoguttaceae bacterium]
MKIGYLDCSSGISGDMMLGALVDVGVPFHHLDEIVQSLGLPGVSLTSKVVMRRGFRATKVDVVAPHEHAHRTLSQILEIIDKNSQLSGDDKLVSSQIFRRIASVEANIHGVSVEEVHFHEVGAADSIADIIGTVVGLNYLELDTIISSPVPTGCGTVEIAHGRTSVPAPATLALLSGVPIAPSDVPFELTTPTGAAFLATFVRQFGPIPAMSVEKIGYGAGGRDLEQQPNLLRLLVGSAVDEKMFNSKSDSKPVSENSYVSSTSSSASSASSSSASSSSATASSASSTSVSNNSTTCTASSTNASSSAAASCSKAAGIEHIHKHKHIDMREHFSSHLHDIDHQFDEELIRLENQLIFESEEKVLDREHWYTEDVSYTEAGKHSPKVEDEIWVLETNIDDMPAELIGYCVEKLWELDVLDVYTTAIIMKKNRPGVKLTVMTRRERIAAAENVIFRETTTLGIRKYPIKRTVLERTASSVQTDFGTILGKVAVLPDGSTRFTPEYESAKMIAVEHDIPLLYVYQIAINKFYKNFDPQPK